jgi:putative phage-type endonuclease
MGSRQEWLAERQSIPGVGASEAAALFGLHPNVSAFSLFEKLVNPKPPTDEELEEEADVTSFGLAIEPYLADWYERKTKREVYKPRPVSRLEGRPYIFASLDCLYRDAERQIDGDLELKSALFFNREDPLPDYWQVQAQQQMLCADLRFASFAILGGFRRRYLVNDIPRNKAFCEILVETIDRFMVAVQEGSWARWGGDIDGSRATTEAIRRLYPHESGTVRELPAQALDWYAKLTAIQEQLTTLGALEAELKNRFRAAIGEATYGRLPDGSGFSLKTTKGSTYTVTKDAYRTLRRIKKIPGGLTR